MKKTMIALLALGGMACATTITLDGDNAGTLVVHLNVATMQDIAGNGFGGAGDAIDLFTYTGTWDQDSTEAKLGLTNNGSSSSHKTGLYYRWVAKNGGANNVSFSADMNNIFTPDTDWDSIDDIAIAYSWNSIASVTNVYTSLSYITKDGTITTVGAEKLDHMQFGGSHYTMNATGITLNDTYVASYENTIDAITSLDDIKAMSIAAVTPATPEPATATLSLLALAGLASRRRRH